VFSSKSHSLYRCYDQAGDLLYVGISVQPYTRVENHRRNRKWGDLIKRVTVVNVGTEVDAGVAEKRVIETELPRYNQQHNPRYLNLPDVKKEKIADKVTDAVRNLKELRRQRGSFRPYGPVGIAMRSVSKSRQGSILYTFDPPVVYPARTPVHEIWKMISKRIKEIRDSKMEFLAPVCEQPPCRAHLLGRHVIHRQGFL
jgi:hypothetical protein